MTRRPFDRRELDRPSADAERSVVELESYLADTAMGAPRGLEERVMAAIEAEPAPRRGFLASLLAPAGSGAGMRRLARAGLLGATLVMAVAGALFAGQLSGLIHNVGSGSPTPTPTESVAPSQTESLLPSPTTSQEATPSGSPAASEDVHGSPGASTTSGASAEETPDASPEETPEGSKTPGPSATGTPSETPTSSN